MDCANVVQHCSAATFYKTSAIMFGALQPGLLSIHISDISNGVNIVLRINGSARLAFLHPSSALPFLFNQGSVIFWLLVFIVLCRFYADPRKRPEGVSFGAKQVNRIDD